MTEQRRGGVGSRRWSALATAWQARLVVVGLVVLAAVAVALPHTIGLPTFSVQHLATPSTLICSWFAALLAAQAGVEPDWDLYATAGSRPRVVNLTRILIVGALGGAVSATILGNAAMSYTAVTALLGVGLIGGAALGHRLCWVAPTAYLIVIIGAGALDQSGAPRLWAAAGNEFPGSSQVILATGLLILGSIAWWRSSTRQAGMQHRD